MASKNGKTGSTAKGSSEIVIKPASGWFSFDLREFWKFRDLFWLLALRSIQLRYKQTAIGILWVILQPLLASAILAVVFGKLGNLPADGDSYFFEVYAAMLAWNLFDQIVRRGSTSFVGDRALVVRCYFPRAILPLSQTVAVLLDLCVALGFFFVLALVSGHSVSVQLLSLPLLVILTLLISSGTLLTLSALNVYFRDVTHALPFLLRIMLFASPVAYSANLIPEKWRLLYDLNPLSGVIEGFRWALLGGRAFPLDSLLTATVLGILCFVSGSLIFNRLERGFADTI